MITTVLSLESFSEKQSSTSHPIGQCSANEKEMVFLEPHSRAERTPLKISTSLLVSGEINQDMDSLTTPTKGKESLVCEPWTPTANLKMLISAASPEIRNREMELGADDREVTGSIDVCQENLMEDDPDKLQPSRKEKSLGLLCHKFLARYPDYPNPALNNNICLDEVAGELSVERRRIYDIVNVLESLHMVSRLAKNRYTWHGRCNLIQTLAALKKVGEEHQYAEQMQQIKQKDFEKEFESDNEEKENKVFLKTKPTERDFGHKEMCFVELPGMEFKAASVNGRKDKSLRVMSQKFVMLFLVSTPRIVSLEVAAKILIGEDQVVDLDKSKFKTKIRRLYDIANVLSSLQLIKKVHVTEERGRKPAFKWTGPETFPSLQDSNPLIATTSVNPTPLNSRSSIENCTKNLFPDSNAKQSFTRHPSLIKLAKSIDDDRRKINSAPSTPLKKTCNCSSENSTGQIPFVCKSQLEEYTKSDKQKLDEQNVEHQLQTKGNNGIGIVKPVLTSELSGTIASPTDSFQLKTALPIAQSSLIPMLLPQSHNNGPYAIYFHAPSVRPMANPSSLAVRSMTFGENLSNSESPSRRCSGNMTSASPANEKDINTEGANLFQNIGTPDKNLKRVLAEKSPEESSPKQAKVQIQTSAAYRDMSSTEKQQHNTCQKNPAVHKGLLTNRPTSRALHLEPEFINTPEVKDNFSGNAGKSVEYLLANEERGSIAEAGLTPLRTFSIPAFTIPAHLQAETLIPTGYLIPLTSQSVLGCSGDLDPERKAEHNSVVHPGAFSSPTTGMASVSPDCARFTSPTGAALSKVSVSSFPRMNQSSPSMASNHHLNSPSPAILNFTLQNLGLISPGIQAPVEHVSPIPNHFGFQQGGMIFVKPVSPVPIQHQISAQPVTLLSLQQSPVLAAPKGVPSLQKEAFFHTPVSAACQLATVSSSVPRTSRPSYVPQRKLEVSSEDS
ncbi:transcription factor E2F8 isoform X1 [Polypterus senegalus]|uniref:transcription factor E2F8 isoform X1 n=2 Tax=Polypterus senegalus TaxID=55291 RepID=UPI0019665AE4|nr:transcription factor E2F8 isoform X1 [Polypterus senegalus]XP_039605365.1 transcription factor E2F8 isoform X1 [Polypterus senegalus]